MRLDARWSPEPDVLVVTEAHRDRIGPQRLDGPADLVIEIASDGDRGLDAAPVPQVDADAPPLNTFDIYLIGSADGNVLFADVYGVVLEPFRSYRLTADKRISAISANRKTVALAAGDEQIDKLGMLVAGGEIAPIPGLGRPHAFSPEFQPDGTLRFSDLGPGEEIVNRYVSYDLETQKTTVLFKSKDEIEIDSAATGGGFFVVDRTQGRDSRLVLTSFKGAARPFSIAPSIGGAISGKRLVAVPVYSSADPDDPATDTAVLNPKNDSVETIKGWAPLGWAPDGTRLLVVRTGMPALLDSELAVIDPANPDQPQILGTIPGLTVYGASWVERRP